MPELEQIGAQIGLYEGKVECAFIRGLYEIWSLNFIG